jgi:hypothetical protein
MGYFYDIRCGACGYEQPEYRGHGAFYAYLLSDGSTLSVPYVPAWCHRCQAVMHGEELPEIAWLEQQLREWQASGLEKQTQAWHVAWLERKIAWRSERRSPAKCLACGSSEIVRGSFQGGAPHPSCGGWLALRRSGHFSLMEPLMQSLYSPEGEALGRQAELQTRKRSEQRAAADRPRD